jgi:hypothetical protein
MSAAEKIIVTLAGGRHLLGAAVQVLESRALGNPWPHVVFTLPGEDPGAYGRFFLEHDVELREVRGYEGHPWTAKTDAVLQAGARHVLFLDADVLPLVHPDRLLEVEGYRATGALFWRDFKAAAPDRPLWAYCGVSPRPEWEMEAGQILIDTERCLRPLAEMRMLNKNWRELYRITHGDKDVWRMSWHRAGQPWAWASEKIRMHLDDAGRGKAIEQLLGDDLVFHHRCHAKFTLGDNWWRPGIPNSLRWFEHVERVREWVC